MTPEQYEKAEKLKKLINNNTGIYNMLHDATNTPNANIEIKFAGTTYRLSESLVHEFVHSTQRLLNKLETEFNEL